MDNQNVLVIGLAVVGMFVVGGLFLTGPDNRDRGRPTYAADDIRHKYQQDDLKKKKKGKKSVAKAPTFDAGSTSTNASSNGDASPGDNEEPSVFDHEPQEEPPLD